MIDNTVLVEGIQAVAARLIALYADVPPGDVRACVEQAAATVERRLGAPDLVIAEGLAQLRLDVRSRLAS